MYQMEVERRAAHAHAHAHAQVKSQVFNNQLTVLYVLLNRTPQAQVNKKETQVPNIMLI